MNRILIILLFLFMSLIAQSQNSRIKLSGNIKGLKGADVALLNADKSEILRVKGHGDYFLLKANVMKGDGRVYYIYVPSLGSLGPSMTLAYDYFFIDNSNIEMRAEINNGNLKIISIKNSPASKEYKSLFENNRYQSRIQELGKRYNKAFHNFNEVEQSEINRKRLSETSDSLDLLYGEQKQSFLKMIPQHKNSDALFLILYSSCSLRSIAEIEHFLNQFDSDLVSRNYYAKELNERIQLMRNSSVGSVAPDFVLADLHGDSVKLSSLRGRYILMDFWASWCGPCRKEIPNVKKISEEYKDLGLQTIGVSIDTDEKKWRQAVDEEKIDYLQLWDPKMTTGKLYSYNGIPFIIFIAPDGKIIEKNLRGDDIKRTVNKYLKGKPFEISVNLKHPYKGNVYLAYVKDRFTKIDSLVVNGTSFSFKGIIDRSERYRVIGRHAGFDASLLVEPGGTYNLEIDNDRNYSVTTSNGKEQLLMNEFLESIEPIKEKVNDTNIRYSKLKGQKKDQEAEELQKIMGKYYNDSEKIKLNFIRKYPKSFAAVVVADRMLSREYPDVHEVYNLLDSTKYGNTYYWKSFKVKYKEIANKWIKNRPAPDFITKDIRNKMVRLKDFRGKYLLLDFWASWCRPCRVKMKELKAVYPELLKKGITVCSISLDDKKDQWLKASKEDQVVWVNTCDLKAFKNNEIAASYKVTNVPTLFLIDPNGVIIKQNPSLEEILSIK